MYARRTVVKQAAGLSLAAVLADPLLARAAAGGLEAVSLTVAGKSVGAALALPATTPAPAIILIHEWWGLNDQIKAVAAEFAKEGYVALAVDLYGEVAGDPEKAKELMGKLDPAAATAALAAWNGWLRQHAAVSGKVATVGWCFGGGWSLNASLAAPVDATIIYYGNVVKTAAELAPLKGPVLGHFATRDQWINQDMVSAFAVEMEKAGKAFTAHWYEADHAFANPTGDRYDGEGAQLAWARTLEFLRATL
ncbi:MAG: dienelactone hydrolase family protein [Alphaproteobacteria bacterium]|nr:dienelactone hydrolase family protein [Alphaproteobacteria bacterium]